MLRSLFIFLLLFTGMFAFSQDKPVPLVSGKYQSLTFREFVLQVEASSPYFFYYDPNQVDSIRVNIEVDKMPLDQVLTKVFANTNLHFSIDRQNKVYITNKFQLVTVLPEGFGNSTGTSKGNAKNQLVLET